ncbi:calcium-binding protein [Planktotalea sp.]|uniref:calcium-binding protein n=1 Tax=Planktotalea sp. TaxID=2029877 RepID=UPI003298D268
MLILAGLLGMVALGSFMLVEPTSGSDESDDTNTFDEVDGSGESVEEDDVLPDTDFLSFIDEDGIKQTLENEVTQSDDLLIGSTGSDEIEAQNGDDFVLARDGDDTIDGGDGNDVLHGNEGADDLSGNEGLDELHGEQGDDLLNGQSGADTLFGNIGADHLIGGTGDDNLVGGEGNDALWGDEGNDTLVANEGADTLDGGSGQDLLMAGAGSDILNGIEDGEQSADFLNGGDGDDTILAGAGDQVSGGDGADTTILSEDMPRHAQIWDFESGLDTLVVLYDGDEEIPEIDISENPDAAGRWIIHADGETVAHITGDVPTQADISLIARS